MPLAHSKTPLLRMSRNKTSRAQMASGHCAATALSSSGAARSIDEREARDDDPEARPASSRRSAWPALRGDSVRLPPRIALDDAAGCRRAPQ